MKYKEDSTVKYYSAMKKNEIMPSAASWMHPEMAILSETKVINIV